MRILLSFVILAGALQAEGKRDFFERYARLGRFTAGPRTIRLAPPPQTTPARCSVDLQQIPARSRDRMARPVPEMAEMPRVAMPAPPCPSKP